MNAAEPDYIFDPCWVIEPDGRIWLREVSLIRNPKIDDEAANRYLEEHEDEVQMP